MRKGNSGLPEVIRGDRADALARLDEGLVLSMPLSRPMPDMGNGVHELRLRDRSGVYRVFYFIRRKGTIFFLRAMKKTTQALPVHTLALVKIGLKELK